MFVCVMRSFVPNCSLKLSENEREIPHNCFELIYYNVDSGISIHLVSVILCVVLGFPLSIHLSP